MMKEPGRFESPAAAGPALTAGTADSAGGWIPCMRASLPQIAAGIAVFFAVRHHEAERALRNLSETLIRATRLRELASASGADALARMASLLEAGLEETLQGRWAPTVQVAAVLQETIRHIDGVLTDLERGVDEKTSRLSSVDHAFTRLADAQEPVRGGGEATQDGAAGDDFLDVFREEAEERFRAMRDSLSRLAASPEDEALLERLRQCAHAVKGAAGMVGLSEVTRLARRMEGLLERMCDREYPASAVPQDLLPRTFAALEAMASTQGPGVAGDIDELHRIYDALLREEPAARLREVAGSGASPFSESLDVLVVDDSALARKTLSRALEQAGWRCSSASDGMEALDWIRSRARPPDVVLLDLELPRLDGIGLTKALRSEKRYGSLPILVLSSHAGESYRQKAAGAGATDYLIKPVDDDELVLRVAEAVGKEKRRNESGSSFGAASVGPEPTQEDLP